MAYTSGVVPVEPRPPSAPYGQACTACSKAKTRCIGRGPQTACERCRRLDRQCQPSAVLRKSRTPKRPRSNNTAVLEKKLDELTSLLSIRARGSGETSGVAAEEGHAVVAQADGVGPETASRPLVSSLNTPISINRGPGPTDESRSWAEDEECLETFRDCHLQSFPFYHIPPGTTPSQLRSEKPVFWLAISAICCKTTSRRKALELEFRTAIAQRYVVELERSIDILLGLITFVSWYYPSHAADTACSDRTKGSHPGQKFLSSYSSMISSLVFDLRLDRVVRWAICRETDSASAFIDPLRLPLPPARRTYEERRAVIAAYCACASAQIFLRTPPMRWTPHMQDSLDHLLKEPEVPGDEVLAAMASALRIEEDVIAASGWRFFEPEVFNASKPPPMVHVRALSTALENLRKSLRPELLETKIVRVHLLFVEASINELPLQRRPSDAPGSSWIDLGRAECFQSCISAVKQLFEATLAFTPRQIYGVHFGPLIQFAMALHMLYRISMAPYRSHASDANGGGGEPMWDSRTVRAAVDLPEILDRTATLFLAVPGAVGLEADGSDPYTVMDVTLKNAKAIWGRVFEQAESGGVVGGDAAAGADDGIHGVADGWMGMDDVSFLDFGGDFWMSDAVQGNM